MQKYLYKYKIYNLNYNYINNSNSKNLKNWYLKKFQKIIRFYKHKKIYTKNNPNKKQ